MLRPGAALRTLVFGVLVTLVASVLVGSPASAGSSGLVLVSRQQRSPGLTQLRVFSPALSHDLDNGLEKWQPLPTTLSEQTSSGEVVTVLGAFAAPERALCDGAPDVQSRDSQRGAELRENDTRDRISGSASFGRRLLVVDRNR
jgi:hypothetical protein